MSSKPEGPAERLLSYEQARERLDQSITWKLPVEEIVVKGALGRVLREDIKSDLDLPPFARSAMDGYAVRAADTRGADGGAPVVLRSGEDLPAGRNPKRKLEQGVAARIMTGAPLPAGADAVVMVEETERTEAGVKILRAVEPGENVGHAGEDVKKGAVVFRSGERINPAMMGMLSALGRTRVKVSYRPRVALLSTGDEVMAPGQPLKPGRIYDANGYSLIGLTREYVSDLKFLGIAPDRPEALARKLNNTAGYDLIILTGGVSVGDYDFVTSLLQDLDFTEVFYKAAIQPGKPTFVGKKGKQLVFGLPGNPVSSMVCYHLFVRPALDRLLGRSSVGLRPGRAIMDQDFRVRPGRRKFLRGRITQMGPELRVQPHPNQKSGVLSSMVYADILIDVPGDARELAAGSAVDIWWI